MYKCSTLVISGRKCTCGQDLLLLEIQKAKPEDEEDIWIREI